MCGRYATTRSATDLSALFDAADETDGELVPDYNVAPTDPVPIVRLAAHADGARVLSVARWGLVPHWANDPRTGARMINARSETVAGSATFRRSFAERRCLVPADGWYEWAAPRRPYFMTARDGGPLVFAGLWTSHRRLGLSCTVLTTPAVGELTRVHDRMPLVLPRHRWAYWLGAPAADPDLLAPPPSALVSGIEMRAVGAAVGDVRNDGPDLIAPVSHAPAAAGGDDPPTLF